MLIYLGGPGCEPYLPALRAAGMEAAARPGLPLDSLAREALAAGADLLWAPDPAVEEADLPRVSAAFAAAGRRFTVAYLLRYLPPIQRAVQLVRQGAVGSVLALRLAYQTPPGAATPEERLLHLADLYAQVTGAPLGACFHFPGSPFRSGGTAAPASLDLREAADGFTTVTLEVIGAEGTLLADGFGQQVSRAQGRLFVGDRPEPLLVAALLHGSP